jgi:hypothetical protein
MLKAADALAAAGYRVRVVSTRHVTWATTADQDVVGARRGAWTWAVVDYHRESARGTYVWSGLRLRASQGVARAMTAEWCPLPLAARAYARAHSELVRAVLAEPADFLYGGTAGGLAAVAVAARAARIPYAVDLEDFHSAEQPESPRTRLAHGLARRIEGAVLRDAAFMTAASPAIAAAYREAYGFEVATIHNSFPLPAGDPDPAPRTAAGLRLYWFSQTIGGGRGLEDVIRAVGRAHIAGELHLRGWPLTGYLDGLRRLARSEARQLTIVHHEPAAPDAMVDLCREYDVGLAVEPGLSLNNRLALSNKAFTYLLAGLAVAFTDTPAQRTLALDLGEGAVLYPAGDPSALAAGLRRWDADRDLLRRAKQATWAAARRRWHWEHPEERGALLSAVTAALARRARCA